MKVLSPIRFENTIFGKMGGDHRKKISRELRKSHRRTIVELLRLLQDPTISPLLSACMKKLSPSALEEKSQKKGVLFDANGVLYFRPQSKKTALKNYLLTLGYQEETLVCLDRKEKADDDSTSDDGGKTLARVEGNLGKQTHVQYYTSILDQANVMEVHRAGCLEVLFKADNEIKLFEGVTATLSHLKGEKGCKLGVITNTVISTQKKKDMLASEGLTLEWDTFFNSCEAGVMKPDPKIFELAVESLSLKAEETVYVSHKVSELEGAKKAGYTTVLFNGKGEKVTGCVDHVIDHFSELMEIIN
jgi:epoxide hydrolase-like predicted phosphatase